MHFSVLVLSDGKSVKELLAPYQENNMGDCPKEFLKFFQCAIDPEEEFSRYKEENDNEYKSLDEFMTNYYGYTKNERGEYGYYENPNACWDWYETGGRFDNSLKTYNGEDVNKAKLKDIDFKAMSEQFAKSAEDLWEKVKNDPNKLLCYNIREDETKEEYVSRNSNFYSYAVVTPDGKWHSAYCYDTKDLWYKSYYDNFINNAKPNLLATLVDCHI